MFRIESNTFRALKTICPVHYEVLMCSACFSVLGLGKTSEKIPYIGDKASLDRCDSGTNTTVAGPRIPKNQIFLKTEKIIQNNLEN